MLLPRCRTRRISKGLRHMPMDAGFAEYYLLFVASDPSSSRISAGSVPAGDQLRFHDLCKEPGRLANSIWEM